MQDDELATLRKLREEVTRIGEVIDRAIIQRENRIAEDRAEERRRHFKLVAIPIGVGVAAAATRAWIARNSQMIVVAGGGAAVASGIAAVLVPQISEPPDHADADRQPAVTAPTPALPDKSPAPTPSPSKPRIPAPRRDAPTPSTTPTAAPPPATSHRSHPLRELRTTTPLKPLHPLHPLESSTPPSEAPPCRVYLPHLMRHGLLCHRPGR